MNTVEASLATAVLTGTPLLYASLGELLGERIGLLNIGLDGMMLIGGLSGFVVAVNTGSPTLGLLAAGAATAVFTLLAYTLPVLLLRSPQGVVGFGVWFIGVGLSSQLGQSYTSKSLKRGFTPVAIPGLHRIPWVGSILFDQPWPVYLGIVLTVLSAWVMARTRHGLNVKAIGEDPASAHAAGVPVRSWQTFYSGLTGFLVGMGGAVLTLALTFSWKAEVTAGRGWIALALVIFAGWRPLSLLWASFLFGGFLILADLGQVYGWGIPSEFLSMAPYVFTIVMLVLRAWRSTAARRTGAEPAALGLTFIRGER